MSTARKFHGFTIIEVMVVMTVLGLLATAAIPVVELTAKRSKERELKQSLLEMRRAIDAYKTAYDAGRIAAVSGASGYPPSLPALIAGVPDIRNGGQPLYFLRRLPKDPFAPREAAALQSWGVRSYASSAEQPKSGEDVFDIYSLSNATGISGVPYNQW